MVTLPTAWARRAERSRLREKGSASTTSRHRAYGVWRASFYPAQYAEVLGAKPAEINTVMVLRHNGTWDKVLEYYEAL